MARISTYNQDPNLEGADRVIGSDASNAQATMNFSLNSLGDFYTRSGLADATRLGYRFNTTDITFTFTGGSSLMSDLTAVNVPGISVNGYSVGILDTILNNGVVKLISTRMQGPETTPTGYYNVTGFAGTPADGFDITLEAITGSQEGSFSRDTDSSFILLPFVQGGSGTTTPGQVDRAFRNFRLLDITGTTLATIDADGTEDTLDIHAGTGITLAGVDEAEGGNMTISHGDTGTATGAETLQAENMLLSSLTIDEFGHISNATFAQGGGTQISQLPFPTLSGNFSEAGFSGAAHSHTFTLSGVGEDFTIDPQLANNVATIAQNSIETVTVNATWTATQNNLMTHVDSSGATRTFSTFRPVYLDIVANTNPTDLPNGLPTTYTFVSGDRILNRISTGSTITLNPGSTSNPEAIVILANTDFDPTTIRFRTGGFLIINPESTITGLIAPDGITSYTGYVISLTPGTILELEIL